MQAAQIHDYHAAPTFEDVSIPPIGPNDVLVRVRAASLNPLDVKLQNGLMKDSFPLHFPYTPGTDLSGTIDRIGSNVIGWSEGDPVVARVDPTAGGALAQFAAVPASYLVAVPVSISLELAAGIPTTGGTAWQALFEAADLKQGQTVLILGGAGGVGSFAVQFARSAGARVFATASGEGVQIVRQLGAEVVIDHRSEDFVEKVFDVDIVVDTVGGDTQERAYGVLRAGGMLIAVPSPPDMASAKAHNVTAIFFAHGSDARRLRKVVDAVEANVRVLIDRTMPLESVAEAYARQQSGHARGKILVTA